MMTSTLIHPPLSQLFRNWWASPFLLQSFGGKHKAASFWKDEDVLDFKNIQFDLVPPRPALENRTYCQSNSRENRAQFLMHGALQPVG